MDRRANANSKAVPSVVIGMAAFGQVEDRRVRELKGFRDALGPPAVRLSDAEGYASTSRRDRGLHVVAKY